MTSLMEAHQDNTGCQAEVVVGDSKYGTVNNFLECYDRGIKGHFTDIKEVLDKASNNQGIFGHDKFKYDADADAYICPTGALLKRRAFFESTQTNRIHSIEKSLFKM